MPSPASIPQPENLRQIRHPALQAVIFDVDGTLAETEAGGHRVAFNRAFAEFGVPWRWPPAVYGQWLGITGGKERLRAYIAAHAAQWLERDDFDVWLARLHERKSAIYSDLVNAGAIALRPGVARLIGELRGAGVRLAIATTTTRSSVDSLIQAGFGCASNALFDVIGAGDVVANKKPAPDVYLRVLKELRLPASDCLAIEDSEAGLRAARAAGLQTVLTLSAQNGPQRLDGALCVISSLGEPDAPTRHIAGRPLAGRCVDLAQLRSWHQAGARPSF